MPRIDGDSEMTRGGMKTAARKIYGTLVRTAFSGVGVRGVSVVHLCISSIRFRGC